MITNLKPLILKSQQNWSRDSITKNIVHELEIQRKQINEIENYLEIFSFPNMKINM